MSSYITILKKKKDIMLRLDEALMRADSDVVSNIMKVNIIQRYYRGSKLRATLKYRVQQAIKISRVYRGHKGRTKVKHAKNEKETYKIAMLHNYFALLLQKTFRGYFSRKYRQNHARRKQMLQDFVNKGEEIRRQMYQYAVDQALREEEEEKVRKSEEFTALAQNLHHLVSTQARNGVYNPPEEFMDTPTVDDIPVEVHIRGAVKDLLRTKGYRKTQLVPDFNGTMKIPLKTLANKLSLQASAPYDAIKNAERQQQILHKVLTVDPNKKFFVSGGKTDVINPKITPLNTGDAYVDAYANPMLIRGVPESQEQLLASAWHRKAFFATAPEKPFVISSGGNMSAVRDNKDFDVIADALQTGGSAKRHLGVTSRFGVPENADYRPPGGVLPTPPTRATTLRLMRPKKKTHRVVVRPLALKSRENPMLNADTRIEDEIDSSDDEEEEFPEFATATA